MNRTDTVRRVFVEKKQGLGVEAEEIFKDLTQNLKIQDIRKVRLFNRYDVSGLEDDEFETAVTNVFSETVPDIVYREEVDLSDCDFVFAIESLPGQYDQRADSAMQCIQILTCKTRPECRVAKVLAIYGDISESGKAKITEYLINPVECQMASLEKPLSLEQKMREPDPVGKIEDFIKMEAVQLEDLSKKMGFAMSLDDLLFIQKYFKEEGRNPTITEIRVLDTYWSDHCRHTTFLTGINEVGFAEDKISSLVKSVYDEYIVKRNEFYKDRSGEKPVCLMDIATMAMKLLKKDGRLKDLDESEEINACSIKVPVLVDGKFEEYLVMFKNETHNHPTEIEPFGGAATCLGGAIRDPLSGRSYVYQAMRVTGSGDPTVSLNETLPGKLSQRKITTKAAAGYSSYGNQIGLATGQVEEIYHPGYIAKRMEIGAVIAAAPAENVIRISPAPGDLVVLLGGRTGRDGCGGATGSSKEHDEDSIFTCGSEVQKGNPPTERKIQRLFRDKQVSTMIKKCNDFGAGGVCVAIGELADGLVIDLDKVLKKYDGLDGTELAISESQERMAVVISPENKDAFLNAAAKENLEAVVVAEITENPQMVMNWRGEEILRLSRDFIDTNGAEQKTKVFVRNSDSDDNFFIKMPSGYVENDFPKSLTSVLNSLQCCSRKGLVERFDSSIGANTVLMPFAGITQSSPEIGMAAKIPVPGGETNTTTVMTFGFDPYISQWSTFHGAYYSVYESLAKITAMGADPFASRLTFQEYFERLGNDPQKWGRPFSALLGAFKAQLAFETPAIGGKDSMSGTFKDLTVPPTLVSFAVSVTDAAKVLSASFSKPGKQVVLLPLIKDENFLPVTNIVKDQFKAVLSWNKMNMVSAAATVREGGIAAAVTKMCFGNETGFKFDSKFSQEELFEPHPGSIILELDVSYDKISVTPEFTKLINTKAIQLLGETTGDGAISMREGSVTLLECKSSWESKLEKVFPVNAHPSEEKTIEMKEKNAVSARIAPKIKIASPKVFIPVFPGTNCEYDTIRAFEKAGACVESVIFRNITGKDIEDSIEHMSKVIKESNIIMIPGGFSGGDEPDGSGKFIASAFKNPYIAEQIHNLLYIRDGLMLGICNGFQALIKLGLLPYGEIRELDESSPTLTYNNIGRHISCYVNTKIMSNRSPWLAYTNPGEIYSVAVSHGEGKFYASEDMVKALYENGQIATCYADRRKMLSTQIPFNPNGSIGAIEGITALDGRIYGKMGHSERIGEYVAKNIPGNKDQKIFKAGVDYFA